MATRQETIFSFDTKIQQCVELRLLSFSIFMDEIGRIFSYKGLNWIQIFLWDAHPIKRSITDESPG